MEKMPQFSVGGNSEAKDVKLYGADEKLIHPDEQEVKLFGADERPLVQETPEVKLYGSDDKLVNPETPDVKLYGADNKPIAEETPDVKLYGADDRPIVEEPRDGKLYDASEKVIGEEPKEEAKIEDESETPYSEENQPKEPKPRAKRPSSKKIKDPEQTTETVKVKKETEEDIDVINLLNKARQSSVEYTDIYNHVFGGKSQNSDKYPKSWVNRPDLIENFTFSKGGNYNSSSEAAHDLIDYLADEAEEKIHTKETKVRNTEKIKEIGSIKETIDLLDKARQNSVEFGDIYLHVFGGKSEHGDKYPKSWINRPDLLQNFDISKGGNYNSTNEAAHDLIEYLAEEAENRLNELNGGKKEKAESKLATETPTETEQGENSDQTEKPPVTPTEENQPATEEGAAQPAPRPEVSPIDMDTMRQLDNTEQLTDHRNEYLRAKRLRGNVFRGTFGRLFGRIMNRGERTVDFGGEQGREDLNVIRQEYQEGLNAHRRVQLQAFETELRTRLDAGEIAPTDFNFEIRQIMVELMREEQTNIDHLAEQGIERNMFEPMKELWRQRLGTRNIVGGALLGGAIITGGAPSIIAARAAYGSVGSYVSTEAALERYSKAIGHKGLIHEINKAGTFVTEDAMYRHIYSLPVEEVQREAARLRMLQVEKGVPVDALRASRFDNGMIADLVLRRANELIANRVLGENLHTENPNLNFANIVSENLAREQDVANEAVENEVDREQVNKLRRKTLAVIAAGVTGWLIGGKLLKPKPTDIQLLSTPAFEGPEMPSVHIVKGGENLWKILDTDLGSKHALMGVEPSQRTFIVDAMKDHFDKMNPSELKDLGFTSGDADILHIKDSLDLSSMLENPGFVARSIIESKGLSPETMASIIKNNAKIATWLAEHKDELKGVYDAQMIDKVLAGAI